MQTVFHEAARTIFERNFRISNVKLESTENGTYGLETLFVESKGTKSKSIFTKLKLTKTPKSSKNSPDGTYGLENLFTGMADYRKRKELTLNVLDESSDL